MTYLIATKYNAILFADTAISGKISICFQKAEPNRYAFLFRNIFLYLPYNSQVSTKLSYLFSIYLDSSDIGT